MNAIGTHGKNKETGIPMLPLHQLERTIVLSKKRAPGGARKMARGDLRRFGYQKICFMPNAQTDGLAPAPGNAKPPAVEPAVLILFAAALSLFSLVYKA